MQVLCTGYVFRLQTFSLMWQLQTLCWKRPIKSPCSKCQDSDSSETVSAAAPSTSFVTLWAIKPACSKFSSALEILTAQLTAVASSLPFLSSAMVLLQGACQRTMWELQALMHFEEREKGWLWFLCADSQVGSQTSILQTFKAALKAVHDQAITLTNSAFSP